MTKRILTVLLLCGLWLTGCRESSTPKPGQPAAAGVGLEIGDVAPEIEGVDLEGVTFKLSDYRGKVVMLDFWGDW